MSIVKYHESHYVGVLDIYDEHCGRQKHKKIMAQI